MVKYSGIEDVPYIRDATEQLNRLIDVQATVADDYGGTTGTIFPRYARAIKRGEDLAGLCHRLVPADTYLKFRRKLGIAHDVPERLVSGMDYTGIYVYEPGNFLVDGYLGITYRGDGALWGIERNRFEKQNFNLTGIKPKAQGIAGVSWHVSLATSGFVNNLSQIKPVFEDGVENLKKYKAFLKEKIPGMQDSSFAYKNLRLATELLSALEAHKVFFLVAVYSKEYNPQACGFRWHKEGEYLGAKEFAPEFEYFANDKNQTIYSYSAYLVE